MKVSSTSSTMIRSSTAPASLSVAGSAPQTSSSPACSLGRIVSFGRRSARRKKSTAVRSTIVCSQLRNSPDRAAVERRGDRPARAHRGRGRRPRARHPDRQAPLDVALVAVDEEHQPAPPWASSPCVARVADVGDQLLVGELLEFVVGERFEGHGGEAQRLESARLEAS